MALCNITEAEIACMDYSFLLYTAFT